MIADQLVIRLATAGEGRATVSDSKVEGKVSWGNTPLLRINDIGE